jgi:SAM-dependent methyltransferase
MHFASYYRWLVATEQWGVPTKFNEPVLDIGADDGQFLTKIEAPTKIGVDRFALPSVSFPWVQCSGTSLPLASSSFGHVFAFDVIEHIEDDTAVLHEAIRVLKPGGTLWLSSTGHHFYIFPGGAIQHGLEQSWGHVRRGYSAEMITTRLAQNVSVDMFWWNEKAFRTVYTALYAMKRISSALPLRLIRPLIHLDARNPAGEAGHIFARVVKDNK